jgi:hypothetical protein
MTAKVNKEQTRREAEFNCEMSSFESIDETEEILVEQQVSAVEQINMGNGRI